MSYRLKPHANKCSHLPRARSCLLQPIELHERGRAAKQSCDAGPAVGPLEIFTSKPAYCLLPSPFFLPLHICVCGCVIPLCLSVSTCRSLMYSTDTHVWWDNTEWTQRKRNLLFLAMAVGAHNILSGLRKCYFVQESDKITVFGLKIWSTVAVSGRSQVQSLDHQGECGWRGRTSNAQDALEQGPFHPQLPKRRSKV